MVCGELQICHDLVLDQNVNDNAYSTHLIHEALYLDHKMVILEIGLYKNKCSHLSVQHQYYTEHDIICVSILFYSLFLFPPLINDSMFTMLIRQMFCNYLSILTSLFCVEEFTNKMFLVPLDEH